MRRTAAVVALVLSVLWTAAPARAVETSDAISLIKEDEAPTNADVALRLSHEVFEDGAPTVLIGRDDVFADSLASGVLQAEAPLLLVPTGGPVPDPVLQRIEELDPGRVILLGGDTAVSPAVAAQLQADYAVERRSGPTRIETAIAIAETDAPQATTAILSRAFADEEGADPTRAFADALAAGGLAAQEGWPTLLTETGRLSASTRSYLERSAIREVLLVGGTSAIGQAVEDELRGMGMTVERLAGGDRFGTALEIAEKAGAESAADVARVTLVEGQDPDAWAGGFAAAAHAARFDAPIVLASGQVIPETTAVWLQGDGTSAVFDPEVGAPVLLCVTDPAVCEEGRQAMRLPPAATVTFDPPPGSTVATGQRVDVSITSPEYSVTAALVNGTCIEEESRAVSAVDGMVSVVLDRPLAEGPCTLLVTFDLPNGAIQRAEVTYEGSGEAPVATAAPTSLALDYRGPASLGPGSIITVGFDQPVEPAAGDTVQIGDLAGDEVLVTCGTTASCTTGGQGTSAEGLSLIVEVTGQPTQVQPRDDGVVQLDAAGVVLGSTVGNALGTWNLAASGLPGGARVFGTLDPSNAVLPMAIAEADVSADAAGDQLVVNDADCTPFGQFHGLRVHSRAGVQIGVADGEREGSACVGRSSLSSDVVAGEEVLVLHRVTGTFVPSRTVIHQIGTRAPDGAPPPAASRVPISTDLDLVGDVDGVLGAGDRIRIVYDDVIAAPGGSGIRVIDHQGDEARVLCGTQATCEVSGTMLEMVLTASPEVVFNRFDGQLQLGTYVAVVDSSLGNAVGNWNLPASGLPSHERVFGTADPTNVALRSPVAPAEVTMDVASNTVTLLVPGCGPLAVDDTARLFDAVGNSVGAADATNEPGGCQAVISPATPLAAGQTLHLVVRAVGAFTPGRTTLLTVPG